MSARSGEKVAARLSPPDSMKITSRSGMALRHLVDGGEIDRGILADRRVRAAAGLHAHDAVFGQRLQPVEDQRILLGVDVVGDGGDGIVSAHRLAELFGQRRLAGADRAADADAQGAVRDSLMCGTPVYWVSCFMAAMSAAMVMAPRSSRLAAAARAAVAAMTGTRSRNTSRPAVCPSGTRRTATEMRAAAKPCR